MDKIKLIFVSLRPRHWVKNIFIFAAPFFSLQLFHRENFFGLLAGFITWCMMTSAMYLFNDIIDKKYDTLHTLKKGRPIASGAIKPSVAFLWCAGLTAVSLYLGAGIKRDFAFYLALYLFINLAYSLYLKEVFILDVMAIAAGFVLRVVSGAVLVNVGVSEWIIMCTLLVSLFLGFGKRQEEITTLAQDAADHRPVLKSYDQGFLERIPYVLVSSTIVCYMLYTVSGEAIRKFGSKNLIYTTPFVIYGLFRYVYIAYEKEKGADPTQVIFSDRPTLVNILLWIIVTGLIIYMGTPHNPIGRVSP